MAQAAKNMPAMQETWIRSLGRSPGEGNGNPLQYSCLGKFHGQGNLASYCPCGCKELDMIEQLTGFPDSSDSKESASNEGEAGSIPGSGRSPGEGMATHSSILAWKIPQTEEPCGLLLMVGHS